MIRLAALLLLALWGTAAARTTSFTQWTLAPDAITLRVTLPDDAARLLVGAGIPAATTAALAAYVLAHVDVHAGADLCPPADQGQDVGLIDPLAPEPGRAAFEILFRCPHGGAIRLDDHILFGRDPKHLDFARIRTPRRPGGVTRLFDASHQSVAVPGSGFVTAAGLSDYAGFGLSDMLGGMPAITLLLALLLTTRVRADLITLAVGLGCGSAAAVALSADRLVLVRPEVVSTVTGLLILVLALRPRTGPARREVVAGLATAIVALALIEATRGHSATAILLAGEAILAPAFLLLPPTLPLAPAQPLALLVPACLFGLLGTAAFANAVAGIGLPGHEGVPPLAGYAAGALVGTGMVAAAAAGTAWLLRQAPGREGAPAAANAAATLLAGLGMWWFVGRLHG